MTRAAPLPRWQDQANCIGADQQLFFPERPPGRSHGAANTLITAQIKAAKTICAGCCVTAECLAYALAFPAADQFGIWGGTTPKEREALRRAAPRYRKPIDHGTTAVPAAHRDRGESPCDACRSAHNAYESERRMINQQRKETA